MGACEDWDARAILHVDMDAFFAAVEQLDHPEWRGRPVIVGGPSKGRGVVAAASYEARRCGVRSAMPSVRAERLCPDAVWAPARFERYREISDAVMAIFREYTPLVQPLSIDEAYLDVTPGRFSDRHPVGIAEDIQRRVDALGVSCSIGVSSSKTVAKIASDHDKPHGLVVVCPGEEAAFLAPMPVSALPGIGPKTARTLTTHGIHTLGELAALDDLTAADLLGSHGPGTVRRAGGIDGREVHGRDAAKSLSAERTFAEDVRTTPEVEAAIERLVARVARRLRAKGLRGRTVTVKVRFSDFTTRTAQRTLSEPIGDETPIFATSMELVRSLWRPGIGLRLLGVGLSGFEQAMEQLELLAEEPEADEKRQRLVNGMDAIRERFGEGALVRGKDVAARGAVRGEDAARRKSPADRGDGDTSPKRGAKR